MSKTFLSSHNATRAAPSNYRQNLEKLSDIFKKKCVYGRITKAEFKAKIQAAKGRVVRATYYEDENLG
jgi:hypothetical protein